MIPPTITTVRFRRARLPRRHGVGESPSVPRDLNSATLKAI
jgi:hypothetical protein